MLLAPNSAVRFRVCLLVLALCTNVKFSKVKKKKVKILNIFGVFILNIRINKDSHCF